MGLPAEPIGFFSGYLPIVWGLTAIVVVGLLAVVLASRGKL